MQSYSPFCHKLEDLKASDLSDLRQAVEGWYIEYKSDTPDVSKLAKSISSFANTYGGWLFLGIQEKSKEEAVAGKFIGIHRDEVDGTLQKIRKSLNDHVNPVPFFETKVLWGPEDSIGLEAVRAVICIRIPRSLATPHIHKKGVIYRRVADSSEPQPENDRFLLDQLWKRADDLNRKYEKWYNRDPEFSKQEENEPYLRIMITPDKFAEQDVYIEATENDIRKIFQNTDGHSVPFETVYSSIYGHVGRQINGDPFHLGLTWNLGHDASSDIIVPLELYDIDLADNIKVEFDGYEHIDNFINVLNKNSISNIKIIDMNRLLGLLIGLVKLQYKFFKLAKWDSSYHVKIKLLNVWRTIPFLDIKSVIDQFDEHGLPMCLNKVLAYPPGTGYDSFFEVDKFKSDETEDVKFIWPALYLFAPIAKAFGVPYMDSPDSNNTYRYYTEVYSVLSRSQLVQKNRIERRQSGKTI